MINTTFNTWNKINVADFDFFRNRKSDLAIPADQGNHVEYSNTLPRLMNVRF